jgi:hypothetical protein
VLWHSVVLVAATRVQNGSCRWRAKYLRGMPERRDNWARAGTALCKRLRCTSHLLPLTSPTPAPPAIQSTSAS